MEVPPADLKRPFPTALLLGLSFKHDISLLVHRRFYVNSMTQRSSDSLQRKTVTQ